MNFGIMKKMTSGIIYNQRDLILIPFNHTDLIGHKHRPALILSNKFYNNSNGDFICCALTAQLTQQRRGILIQKKHLESGQLPKDSILIPPKLICIQQNLAIKSFGTLNKKKSQEAIDFLNLKISLDP